MILVRDVSTAQPLKRIAFARTIDVQTDNWVTATYLYQAKSDRIDADLRPAPWYHLHVAAGARQHSLPLEYQRMIESYSVQND